MIAIILISITISAFILMGTAVYFEHKESMAKIKYENKISDDLSGKVTKY